MKDIAQDLGVSVVTISKVLRNHEDISLETRERVLQRVKELDYRPNLAAKSLATGRSYLMGLVVPDLVHPFFSQIAKGASRFLRKNGYSLIVSSSEEDPELEDQELEVMLGRSLDVFIVASSQCTPRSLQRLQKHEKAFILVDRKFEGFPAHFVGTDDVAVGRIATEHLVENGCRRIACIAGKDTSVALDRLAGYEQSLKSHGLPILKEYVAHRRQADNESEISGFDAMNQLLALKKVPDGVFCLNDPTAMGAMQAIAERGLRIPEDIAIIGCGNVHYGSQLRVALSSIEQNSELIGEHAAKLALGLVEGGEAEATPRSIIMTPQLIARASSQR